MTVYSKVVQSLILMMLQWYGDNMTDSSKGNGQQFVTWKGVLTNSLSESPFFIVRQSATLKNVLAHAYIWIKFNAGYYWWLKDFNHGKETIDDSLAFSKEIPSTCDSLGFVKFTEIEVWKSQINIPCWDTDPYFKFGFDIVRNKSKR